MEDTMIIDLYVKRIEAAITESDRKYGAYCGTIAGNILKNAQDTEECVNDTWLRAWNTIPPTIPVRLKAFFGRIARNLALNRWERERAAKRGGSEADLALDELTECISNARAEEWSADRAVLTDVLNRFLSELPEETRGMFVRRYWYMDPVKDIAARYGAGESKVKMTLMRARRELAKQLAAEGIDV